MMSWALYHLGRQPATEAALLAEIEAFRAAHGGALSTAEYDERPLSWALLAETLRLYPPLQSLPRTTLSDGVVPTDAVEGNEIGRASGRVRVGHGPHDECVCVW